MIRENITVNSRNAALIIDKLNEYGVVIIPNYLTKEDTELLKEEFHKFLSTEDTIYKKNTPYSNGKCVRVNREKLDTKEYAKTDEVFTSPFMRELADLYLGKDAKLNSEIFVVNDVVGTRHHANDLHFDVKPTFKFFIYLTDTTAENGAFSCVPGSHKLTPAIREKNGSGISYEQREISRDLPVTEEDVIPIEGKAGSLIIFTTETFHRAGIVEAGERLVMRGHCRTVHQEKVGQAKPEGLKKILNKVFSFGKA